MVAQLAMKPRRAPASMPATRAQEPAAGVPSRGTCAPVVQRRSGFSFAAIPTFAPAAASPDPAPARLPGGLRADVEARSGLPMDDVRVHYDSPEPATIQAHAYARGADIHLAPGQEQHLPHEAWHVAQQKQGRVPPTRTVGGVPVNDDAALEREADGPSHAEMPNGGARGFGPAGSSGVVQRVLIGGRSVKTLKTFEAMYPTKIKGETAKLELDPQQKKQLVAELKKDGTFETLDAFLGSDRIASILGDRTSLGGFTLKKSRTLSRRDSLDQLTTSEGRAELEALRAKNQAFQNLFASNIKNDVTNYVSVSVTVNYRIGKGQPVQLNEGFYKQWISGNNQPSYKNDVLDFEGGKVKTDDRSKRMEAFVQKDAFLGRDVAFTKLTSKAAASARQKTKSKVGPEAEPEAEPEKAKTEDDAAGKKKRKRTSLPLLPNPTGSTDIMFRPEPHAHSEIAFASDPELTANFQGIFNNLQAKMGENAVLIWMVLNVDSFPNTMCTNICRSALSLAYDDFDALAKATVAPGNRLSAKFGTAMRVASFQHIQPSNNQKVARFGDSDVGDADEEFGCAKIMIEQDPDTKADWGESMDIDPKSGTSEGGSSSSSTSTKKRKEMDRTSGSDAGADVSKKSKGTGGKAIVTSLPIDKKEDPEKAKEDEKIG